MNGTNADGTPWTPAQWRDHANSELAKPVLMSTPKGDQAMRNAWREIAKMPDHFTPEQIKIMMQYQFASVLQAVGDFRFKQEGDV